MPNPIVHFEIPADDVQRAIKFYEQALGWKISDPWNMNYWLVETKDGVTGINGGLMPRRNPGQPFMNYIQVDSIDDALAKVDRRRRHRRPPQNRNRTGHGLHCRFQRHRRQPPRLPPVPKEILLVVQIRVPHVRIFGRGIAGCPIQARFWLEWEEFLSSVKPRSAAFPATH